MPCFVVIRTTPLDAWMPYSVAAAGPFTISMFSMSSGTMSLMREGPAFSVGSVVEAADVERRRAGAALEPDAVEVIERLVGERNAVGAADADAGAGTGGAAALEHLHARRPSRDQVGELGDRRQLGHLRRIDGGHDVADLELALLAGGGAHHLVELDRRRLHGKVERGRRVGHGHAARCPGRYPSRSTRSW